LIVAPEGIEGAFRAGNFHGFEPTTDPTTEGKPSAVGNAGDRPAVTQTLGSRQRRLRRR